MKIQIETWEGKIKKKRHHRASKVQVQFTNFTPLRKVENPLSHWFIGRPPLEHDAVTKSILNFFAV